MAGHVAFVAITERSTKSVLNQNSLEEEGYVLEYISNTFYSWQAASSDREQGPQDIGKLVR